MELTAELTDTILPEVDPVAVYKAVEDGVVDAYRVVEDTMVDKLFRREGETVEEAKQRLKKK